MKSLKRLIYAALLVALMLSGALLVSAQDATEEPTPDPYSEACQVEDEGVVVPVDQMPERPLRIAVLGLENNPFWIPVKDGIAKAQEELAAYDTQVDWIVVGEELTSDVFGPGIEAAIAQQYDAISVLAGEVGLVPYINSAVEAGIPVATYNSETDTPSERLLFVGADSYLQGQAAAHAMADAIGGEGKVGIITGFFAVESHELRRTGFVDTITAEYPDIEIVGEVENKDQADTAYTQAQDYLAANPDLAGIYVTAGGPFGAAKAVQDEGLTGEVWVVAFDFVEETMQYIEEGVVYATIGQNPFAQGHDPIIRLYNYLVAGVEPECPRLVTEAAVVTLDNLYDYWTPADSE